MHNLACGLRTCRICPVLCPTNPTREQAEAALHLIRETFKTFCFADAANEFDATTGLSFVDTSTPPG